LTVQTAWGSLGVPLKFLVPGMIPLAIHLLDTVFVANSLTASNAAPEPFGGAGNGSPQAILEGQLPLWFELSPWRNLTIATGVQGYAYANVSQSPAALGATLRAFVSLNGTLRWFDIGAGVEHYEYSNGAQSLTAAWFYTDFRIWT